MKRLERSKERIVTQRYCDFYCNENDSGVLYF